MTTAPATDQYTDEAGGTQTPDELLVDLAELHTRTIVSPQPKNPVTMGWQAVAGSMAAGFARALHALNEADPTKAAEITDWYQGPFGEGPDPQAHSYWLEKQVAKSPAVMATWIREAQELAAQAQQEATALADLHAKVDLLHAELAEAHAGRDKQIIAWMKKKASEYRAASRKPIRQQADVIEKLADKISRGAVR